MFRCPEQPMCPTSWHAHVPSPRGRGHRSVPWPDGRTVDLPALTRDVERVRPAYLCPFLSHSRARITTGSGQQREASLTANNGISPPVVTGTVPGSRSGPSLITSCATPKRLRCTLQVASDCRVGQRLPGNRGRHRRARTSRRSRGLQSSSCTSAGGMTAVTGRSALAGCIPWSIRSRSCSRSGRRLARGGDDNAAPSPGP